uniref:Prokineticin domain-containing protein n=2 Tax=Strongyloides stercoralis TaxID=6248 RepID=A0A0K0EN62_STRER
MIRYKVFFLFIFIIFLFDISSINCYNDTENGKNIHIHHHKKKHQKYDIDLKNMINKDKNKEMKILIGLKKDAEILKKNLNKQTFNIFLSKTKKQGKVKEDKKENNKLKFLSFWRQRMKNRIKSIMRKIKRLEKKLKKMNLQSINKKKEERKLKTEEKIWANDKIRKKIKGITNLNKSTHKNKKKNKKMNKSIQKENILLEQTKKEERLKSFHLSQNISLNGLAGSSCQSHHECKPGLCCHRVKHPKPSDPIAICVLHDLIDGSPCKHSCACQSGLQCFSPSKNPKIINSHAICKKASTSDFINGVYENSKETVFDMDHIKFSS